MPRIDQILGGAAHAVGFDSTDPRDAWAADARTVGLEAAPSHVVVLIDGMGFHQVDRLRGHVPYLRRRLTIAARTTFPSTTACAITSFATGRSPGQTGMVGFTARNPETGSRLQLLSFEGADTTPEEFQREATIGQRAGHDGAMCSVGPRKFAASGLTRAAWRGVREVYAESLPDRVAATVAQVRAGARLVYLYWSELDHIGHASGWQSEAWTAQLEHVDACLQDLARRLPAGTGLVITADHGMVDIERRIDIADAPFAPLVVTAGEERTLHLFAPDADLQRLRGDVEAWCADAAQVLTREDAAELMAPVADANRRRIGDLVLAARGGVGIADSRWMSENQRRLVGAHGSLSDAERDIPLVVERA